MASTVVTIKLESLSPVVARLRAANALAREVDRALGLDEPREVLADALRDFHAVAGEWRRDDDPD